jgi:hypothetical protein
MTSLEREVESALISAVSATNIPYFYTSEREGARLLPNLTAQAKIANELLVPFSGVFGLSATLTYTSRADSVTRAGFDHEFETIVQELYRDPSLASYMTSNSDLKVYKASINSEVGSIVSTNRTWKREISININATVKPPPNPSLLLHMDGTNGSTNFIDSSLNNFEIMPYGAAQISTAQYKFGGASGYFDGAQGSYIQTSLSEYNWNQDFTAEMWIYYTGGNDNEGVFSILAVGNIQPGLGGLHLYIDQSANLVLNNGVSYVGQGLPITLNTWTHIAITRKNGINRLFQNGILTLEASQEYPVENAIIQIGAAPNYGFYYYGYIDELRIIKGYAAYTSNFTPPTQAFPNP